MKPTLASPLHRKSVAAGLALMAALAGCGGQGGSQTTASLTPKVTTVGRTIPAAPSVRLAITSPAFGNGARMPVQYTCQGANVAPPLTWAAPREAALVVDDPDAVGGAYVHWIVTGIAPGSGTTGDGETPGGGTILPNSAGQPAYAGPCPPANTGVHHYRFTLYQFPYKYQLPDDLGGGVQAAQTIAGAANAQAQVTGTFGG